MKKIIIAEDSSVIQNLTKKILQIQNFSITAVKNGKEVLEKLNSEDYDLILMDINMPQMDGMECAKHIRGLSDPIKSQIPILAITGNAKNYSISDFKEVGINEYIPKPLNFDLLVDKVKMYTEDHD
ncbi:response regulator [Reichenbachiella agarivorans]|uniref:Response regulator n=1 Tax=Reichenbachiella agarivorans TaxID=2979464 RepID=A0ABY6CLV4_9BACT|nr:response regulator [Reichenbachiella agarivorans]UXP31452.1 response regulator [Reichenbachiella agarivorans]